MTSSYASWSPRIKLAIALWGSIIAVAQAWTPIVVKNVTQLGPQVAPDVTDVSRDGGYSALINGKIVWLYDDTECLDSGGNQLSFVSNTAAYASEPNKNLSILQDFGVQAVGKDKKTGKTDYAILADTTVGTGGWVPFLPDELAFNDKKNGVERVAIWPGTSPTPLSTTQAFLYAPLVYVDSKPQDPSKEYQARGMTLIAIKATSSGPTAQRQGDLIIPGTQVAYGGFSSLLGYTTSDYGQEPDMTGRDVYLLGMTNGGLQLARVGINGLNDFSQYSFWEPQNANFSKKAPGLNEKDYQKIYLPGTFSSGSVFFSPYFNTFIMVYFNKLVDSTFRIRFLDLNNPVGNDPDWQKGGRKGQGLVPEDALALIKYGWSSEQELYKSPPGQGGFNYAGIAHPEFFNRQYFAPSLYPGQTPARQRRNAWYGSKLVPEDKAGGDGKHLLLSWTSQVKGGFDTGVYQVQLARVEFGPIPANPGGSFPTSPVPSTASRPTLSVVSSAPYASSLTSSQPSNTALTSAGSAKFARGFIWSSNMQCRVEQWIVCFAVSLRVIGTAMFLKFVAGLIP